ncbi:MAG: YceI family protein [Armatimonadetes bacterium]|nr:YceI family protein [Armatimonadota bacterium]MDW8122240.1 YceI family protein [Armatimonadota bacterium]
MRQLIGGVKKAMLWGVVLLTVAILSPASAQTYEVDPVHSSVVFSVKHLGVGIVYGRFNRISGTVVVNEKQIEKSSVRLEIPADSIDTAVPDRDKHLMSPDFFNARQFRTIVFESKKIKRAGKDSFQVTGDLTLRGVTRSITVTVQQVGQGKGMKGEMRRGFHTTFKIKRSDFGMTFMLNGVSDEVTVMVGIECIQK